MLRSKSSSEKLSVVRQNSEISQRSRYEEFVRRYSLKQKLSIERKNDYKARLKERSMNSQKRHLEAALRRQAIDDEKKSKILARKTRTAARDTESINAMELRASSTPGVFINCLKHHQEGTAGFGKGFDPISENISKSTKKSKIPHLQVDFGRFTHSLSHLDINLSTKSNETSVDKGGQILAHSEIINRKGDDVSSTSSGSSIVSQKIPRRVKKFSKRYQSVNCKRVSFDSPQNELIYDKPIIKKSLIIQTPETKKGILMKMSELSLNQRNNGHLKYEPGMLMRVILPMKDSCLDCVEVQGDDISNSQVNESTNIEVSVKSNQVLSTKSKGDCTQKINCRNLIRTCEAEKLNRKMKLALLHKDLMKIEWETQKLNNKNYEVTKNIVKNSPKLQEKIEDYFYIEKSFVDGKKAITHYSNPSLTSIRSRIDKEKEEYLTDTRFKSYCPVYDGNNSCNDATVKRAIKRMRRIEMPLC